MVKLKAQMSRRSILRALGVCGSAWTLSGCESLDRLILGKAPVEDSVFILGAGLAGLSAAVELKRRKVPFVVLDASRVPGGRVLSLSPFGVADEVLDLGGEWFSSSHSEIQYWLKELRIETIERKLELPRLYDLSVSETRGLQKDFAALNSRVQAIDSSELQKLSVLEIVQKRAGNPLLLEHLRRWARLRFGVEPEFLQGTLLESNWATLPHAQFRIRNGAKALVEALFDRIAGLLPNENFIWQHRLKQVTIESKGYRLIFDTPYGERDFLAQRVISTISPGAMKEIDGMQVLCEGLSDMRMGTQSKGGAYFEHKFWKSSPQEKHGITFLADYAFWDSERRTFQQNGGAISVALGGSAGAEAGLHSLTRWRESLLQKSKGEIPLPLSEHLQNWSQLPTFRGSHFALSPGVSRSGSFKNPSERWIWAGEHVSAEFPGTMEGALRTGKAAARLFGS